MDEGPKSLAGVFDKKGLMTWGREQNEGIFAIQLWQELILAIILDHTEPFS